MRKFLENNPKDSETTSDNLNVDWHTVTRRPLMKTLIVPQKPSIYRNTREQTYVFDEDSQELIIDGLYVIRNLGLMDWGRACLMFRRAEYGQLRNFVMAIYQENPNETECLF